MDSSPLFPLSTPNPDNSTPGSQWLSNPSFTPVISIPSSADAPVSADVSIPHSQLFSSDDEQEDDNQTQRHARYDLLPSGSESDSSEQNKKNRRKKKKKRKRTRDEFGREKVSSREDVYLRKERAKDYYFDVKADPDNLAYDSLYRLDVARYRLKNPSDQPGYSFQLPHSRKSNPGMEMDVDLDIVDKKLRTEGRYCSVNYATIERHKGLKHVKIINKNIPSVHAEYIPLVELPPSEENSSDLQNSSDLPLTNKSIEESWEDEVVRKTRELNKMSRNFPHDEKVWLAFAKFQDEIARTQPQKGARLQTLEKKISILEKAVELNPQNEELLLHLMKSYQERDSSVALMERWEKILIQHYDSVTLWKEFLLVCQGDFSQFKVSDMRRTYAHAIQALSSACEKLCRQGESSDPSLSRIELGLVDIFISLCRFEWQSGYHELATGLFQAEIEYSIFSPPLLISSMSKRRLFEHFWNSGGARLGEDEALGWSTWLSDEDQNKHNYPTHGISQENEGGWSGWSELPSKNLEEHVLAKENTESKLENENIEFLLKNFGVNVDSESHNEVKDSKFWNKWAKEEVSRGFAQWMPVRDHPKNDDDNRDADGDEQLSRIILFEDVNEYMFSLCSNDSRLSLISQFIDFFGGKISPWTSTNNSSWIEKLQSLETLPVYISEDLRNSHREENISHISVFKDLNLHTLLGSNDKYSKNMNMIKYIRNAILLLLKAFPRNHILEEALLVAEECYMNKVDSSACSLNPSRALAKALLKKDRQDLLLCGVYARSEATYMNIEIARKIFDMALSSTVALPPDLKECIPLLYFWYAEMEMKILESDGNSESQKRTIHILTCLGGDIKYTPFKCQPSGLQILKARQGFKEKITKLRFAWARGDVKEYSVALICAASLYEALTTSLKASIEVVEEVFSMALPERRSRSLQLESLWTYYIGMLQKHLDQLGFPKVFEKILQGLQLYPFNPKCLTSMVEVSSLYTVPYKVRRIFDDCIQRNPSSIVVLLAALSFELGKPGSEHRIHGLFEKALADNKLQRSVLLWRLYLSYEVDVAHNPSAARRIFFRAVHACPWSKRLWLDGFLKLNDILTENELSDLQEVMRDKELNLRTDIYEILLQDEVDV